jgi:hypothetical protein
MKLTEADKSVPLRDRPRHWYGEGSHDGVGRKGIPPTGKSFDVEFCTVAHWDENGQIIEENLFYDLVTFMRQIGLA